MSVQPDRPSVSVVSKVLSSAVRLWLRSQVESAEVLDFQIEGGDRQILSGYIPNVVIAARRAVYRGLHLSQVGLTGETIRINLGQVLKGKPLKLLNIVPVHGSLSWDEADLNASLKSPLLMDALAEFFLVWLKASSHLLPEALAQAIKAPLALQEAQATIDDNQLTLKLNWRSPPKISTPGISTTLHTGLSLVSKNRLKLEQPFLLTYLAQETSTTQLQDYEVEIGTDVELQEFRLEPGKLRVQGRLNVLP